MSEIKLKPCPFCGGRGEIVFSGHEYTNGTMKGFIVAKCDVCGGSSKGVYYCGDMIKIPLEETVGAEKTAQAWNRRPENGK